MPRGDDYLVAHEYFAYEVRAFWRHMGRDVKFALADALGDCLIIAAGERQHSRDHRIQDHPQRPHVYLRSRIPVPGDDLGACVMQASHGLERTPRKTRNVQDRLSIWIG